MELNYYILWQIFGILAAVITVCAFIYTDKKKILNLLLIWGIFWILQFAFLWALSWAIINCFWFIRTILAKYENNDKRVISILFIIIFIISYYTYEWPMSLLPLAATCIGTYALFYIQGVTFRIVLIVPTTLWLIYNYYVGSIWGTVREIIILILHIKVILLSMSFAYKDEIYKLNYDIFVYLYNNSFSKIFLIWQRFLHSLVSVLHLSTRKKKWVLWKISSH